MIRLVIQGITGKMGSYLFEALKKKPGEYTVVAGICRNTDVKLDVPLYQSLEACILQEDFDVVVDFSVYPQCLDVVKTAIVNGKHVVSGTTGYKKYDGQHVEYLAKKYNVGVVISPNYSLSDDFLQFLSHCAQKYPYIYISESHGIHKKDKPSGTAAFLAKQLEVDSDHIHSIRIPNVLATHTILFASDIEQLEITHLTANRDAFVIGIEQAIKDVSFEKRIKIMM